MTMRTMSLVTPYTSQKSSPICYNMWVIHLKRFIKNKYLLAGAVVVVILIIYLVTRNGTSTTVESTPVVIGNVIEKVSVTGKISPVDKADLSFNSAGSIAHIYVQVGDSVKAGQIIASLDNADAVASLASAQAKLDDMTRSLRPEEMQVEESKIDSASTTLANTKIDATNAARSGYVQASGAIFNYVDTFFTNPQSANPTLKIGTQSTTIQSNINFERVAITDYINRWKSDLDNFGDATGSTDPSHLLANASGYLSKMKKFIDDVSEQVNRLNPGNSGLTQTVIDAYVSTINTGSSVLNQAINTVISAKTALEQTQTAFDEANSAFVLKNSGSSSQAIRAQQATVDSLAAVVAKGRIYSPIDGIITRADPHEGEYTTPGISGFAVQSSGIYKIEAYVPEADIAKVAIDNHADVTLDAYGSDIIFGASVALIDPAETVLEGVPTYKVTLLFDDKDARIRSGMTANTEIMTHEHDEVMLVPTRAVMLNSDGTKSVRILSKNGQTFATTTVQVGLKGSSGTTEIVSGLFADQKVVTYTK